MPEHDAIVIGSGPAGSCAALGLAAAGHDVLLIERKQFPRSKACGDAVPAAAIERLHSLGLKSTLAAAGFYSLASIRVASPGGFNVVAPLPERASGAHNHVVERSTFDALLMQAAVAAGATVRLGDVTGLLQQNGIVQGVHLASETAPIRARVVIAADGGGSLAARILLDDKRGDEHQAVAIRGYIDGFEETARQAEFFLLNDVQPGYAWVFPLGNGVVNVGVGMRLDQYKRQRHQLKSMLSRFLQLPEMRRRQRHASAVRQIQAWPLQFGSRWRPMAFHGAMLAGDAAGLINPLTGGGIHNAIFSGITAAEVADQALRLGDLSRGTLLAYEKRCRSALLLSTRRSYLLQQHVLPKPRIVDTLVRLAGRMIGDQV